MIDGTPYENLFRAAADDVAQQAIHPGQTMPGLWTIDSQYPPNVLVVTIVAAALSRVAKARDLDFEPILRRYVELSPEVPFRLVGAPDLVAKAHLQDVSRLAAERRTQAATAALLAAETKRAPDHSGARLRVV